MQRVAVDDAGVADEIAARLIAGIIPSAKAGSIGLTAI